MLTPNAFSIRSAISGESAALPFNRSDSVARRTLRISAVRATVRPSSLRISSRMKAPGCGGLIRVFSMGLLPRCWGGTMSWLSRAGRFCQREPEPAIVQMAGGPVARRHLAQYRRFAAAARHRIGAACVEMAARGRIDRAWHITGQDDAVAALGARLWDWHRR